MASSPAARLYTPQILALAVELANVPLHDGLPLRGEARSRSCGSTLVMGLALDQSGAVNEIGMQVTACAIGQAAAALFARQVAGRDAGQLAKDRDAMQAWLAGEGDRPGWPGFELLAPARDYPARHGAILLPWNAALDALCKAEAAS